MKSQAEREDQEWRRLVGRRIGRMREHLHLTQVELARRLGVPRSRLAKWESGANAPPLRTLAQLAGMLGLSADELLTGNVPGLPGIERVAPARREAVRQLILGFIGLLSLPPAPIEATGASRNQEEDL
jgi:transcriptional regulator with XRE-family HTH domain